MSSELKHKTSEFNHFDKVDIICQLRRARDDGGIVKCAPSHMYGCMLNMVNGHRLSKMGLSSVFISNDYMTYL